MKKVSKLFVLVLAFVMIMINCWAVYAVENQTQEDEYDTWTVEETVDEFGDPNGDMSLRCMVRGSYTYNTIKQSELSVIIFYDLEKGFSFRLLENNDALPIYQSTSGLTMKIKVNDEISAYPLFGSSPIGDLYLIPSSSIFSSATTFDELDQLVEVVDTGYANNEELMNIATAENTVRCIIYIDHTKYSFTIPFEGFADLTAPLYYNEGNKLYEAGEYEEAKKYFALAGDYADSAQRIADGENALYQDQYDNAVSLLEEGNYAEAMGIFLELGDYSDASEKASECEDAIKQMAYDYAITIMEQGLYQEAIALFQELGDYSDASEKVAECDELINAETEKQNLLEEKLSTIPTTIEYMGDVLTATGYEDSCLQLRDEITAYVSEHFNEYPSVSTEELIQSFDRMVEWTVYFYGNDHDEWWIRYDFMSDDYIRTNTGRINGQAENYLGKEKWDREISDGCLIWKNRETGAPEYKDIFVKIYDSYYLAEETNCETGDITYKLFAETDGFVSPPRLVYYMDTVAEIIYREELGLPEE